jgi:coenzyme F420-reducing hydrogenase alpha subunit
MSESRTIRVEALTRVEGEGALHIRLSNGQIDDVRLNIYEPPRLFEALLPGRALEDVPDITARICGICPVAYQMSSVHALEAALGVMVTGELRRLRRLLYCGEWIESHALHVHMLHVPDFLGYDSALALAQDSPDEVNRGLRLKKHGNQLLDVLGGRAVHPINVAVGGFYRLPRREELAKLLPDFEWGLQAAIDAARWVAGFDFPQFEQPYDFVAVSHPHEYAMCEGPICTSDGLSIGADRFEQHFREQQVPHSTALQAVRIDTGRTYFLGPLARINLNREQLLPAARRLADEVGLEHPCRNVFKSIIARSIEIVQAYEEALSILQDYHPPKEPRIKYSYKPGEGAAATEAPRGLLYHRYGVDANGLVTVANIVPPTSQNQGQIEHDLRQYLPAVVAQPDDRVAQACERLVRSYDPCISCSTHFLKVTLERGP